MNLTCLSLYSLNSLTISWPTPVIRLVYVCYLKMSIRANNFMIKSGVRSIFVFVYIKTIYQLIFRPANTAGHHQSKMFVI